VGDEVLTSLSDPAFPHARFLQHDSRLEKIAEHISSVLPQASRHSNSFRAWVDVQRPYHNGSGFPPSSFFEVQQWASPQDDTAWSALIAIDAD
jgi:hypothetical protein